MRCLPARLVRRCVLCGRRPENGTVTIDVDVYENYIYGILKSMLYGGFKNIYMLIHHQFEDENYMPMTLACAKAAKKLIMEYMEDTMGKRLVGFQQFLFLLRQPRHGFRLPVRHDKRFIPVCPPPHSTPRATTMQASMSPACSKRSIPMRSNSKDFRSPTLGSFRARMKRPPNSVEDDRSFHGRPAQTHQVIVCNDMIKNIARHSLFCRAMGPPNTRETIL